MNYDMVIKAYDESKRDMEGTFKAIMKIGQLRL